jgi:hypothetical protein
VSAMHESSSINKSGQDSRQRKHWLREAFAVDDPADFQPTDEQRELVEDVCGWMVTRGLTTAALIGVEMHRPANYILANVMHFFRPTVSLTLPLLHLLPLVRRALPDMSRYRAFAEMIEHRGAADYFVQRLEAHEAALAKGTSPSALGHDAVQHDDSADSGATHGS